MSLYIIDARPLQENKITGVEVYAKDFLNEFFRGHQSDTVVFYVNSFRHVNLPQWCMEYCKSGRAILIQTYFPNVIFNMTLGFFRFPKLDSIVTDILSKKYDDVSFICLDPRPSPVSTFVRKTLVLHDVIQLRYPKYFSIKSRVFFCFVRLVKEMYEASTIISVSEFTRIEASRFVDASKIVVRYYSSKLPLVNLTPQIENILREKYHLPSTQFLLSLSTLDPRKGLMRSIQLFLDKKLPYADFVIAGEQYSSIFAKSDLPVTPHVFYTGFIEEIDKPYLYSMAGGFINLSVYEGYGLSVKEAMDFNLPLILSDIPPYREIVGTYPKVTWLQVS